MNRRATGAALIGLLFIGLAAGSAVAFNGFATYDETFQALAPTPAYQLALGPPRTAIITNLSGQDVVGLRIIYSAPVPSATGYGMGAEAAIASNAGMTVVFEGAIGPYGGVYVQWDEEEARILVAGWLAADGTVIPVDLHSPFARMAGSVSYAVRIAFSSAPTGGIPVAVLNGSIFHAQLIASFDLDGSMSATFDGTEIVRYLWEWDDGLIQEGPTVERVISTMLDLDRLIGRTTIHIATVTLTVWAPNGSSSSVTKSFILRAISNPV